jgi:hypothetical protein
VVGRLPAAVAAPTAREASGWFPLAQFLEFCRYLRSLHPPGVRIAIECDFSPHLSTKPTNGSSSGRRQTNAEISHTPTNSCLCNIVAQFRALCYITLHGTDYAPPVRHHADIPSIERRELLTWIRRARPTARAVSQNLLGTRISGILGGRVAPQTWHDEERYE